MIVISQPTYFPWIGYFSLIDACETFVFLDDIQFNSRSWQQRNRIIINNKLHYLTVPVVKKGLNKQLINKTKIVSQDIFDEHLIKIKHAYKKSQFFKEYFPVIENMINKCKGYKNLSEINIFSIKEIAQLLNLKCNFKISSDLGCSGKKTTKLINICIKEKKYDYIFNEGAKNYIIEDLEIFNKQNIKLFFIDIKNIPYKQMKKKFVERLSILDLLFNLGPKTQEFIKESYKLTPFKL